MIEILNEIASDNSRLFKIAVLEKHKENALLKKVFFLAYDPFTQFYQRKIPAYSPAQANQADSLDSVLDSLAMLSTRQVTGHAAIAHLTKLLSSLVEGDAQVVERIIGKDLRVGCSDSSANKVWKNFIVEYPCMLATAYDEKLVAKIKWPAMTQLKMDGMRFNAIVHNGKCEFRTRNGKEVDLLGNLEQEFITLAEGKNLVFDGELVVLSEDGMSYLDRQTGNGILNKAVKGTITDKDASQVSATLWDIIDYEDFHNGVSNHSYRDRFHKLECMSLCYGKIRLVANQSVNDIEAAREIFEHYLSEGQEGIILKDLNSIWENKRSRSQIKMKGELECDLKIVGIQEGTGKYVGKVGAYQCESEDGIIKVDVGSGFKDADRIIDLSVIGKVVAIKYNARIKNKQGQESMFLPIFLEIREDKTEADTSDKIK